MVIERVMQMTQENEHKRQKEMEKYGKKVTRGAVVWRGSPVALAVQLSCSFQGLCKVALLA